MVRLGIATSVAHGITGTAASPACKGGARCVDQCSAARGRDARSLAPRARAISSALIGGEQTLAIVCRAACAFRRGERVCLPVRRLMSRTPSIESPSRPVAPLGAAKLLLCAAGRGGTEAAHRRRFGGRDVSKGPRARVRAEATSHWEWRTLPDRLEGLRDRSAGPLSAELTGAIRAARADESLARDHPASQGDVVAVSVRGTLVHRGGCWWSRASARPRRASRRSARPPTASTSVRRGGRQTGGGWSARSAP